MAANTPLTEEWFADVLQDSLEMDWTSSDGARAIMKALAALPASQPVADVERIAKAERTAQEAMRECASWARQAGEAIGKLEASEMAGVVDGWKMRAHEAEAQVATLTARVETLLDQRVQLRDRVAAVSGYGTDSDILDDDKLVDVVSDLARDYRAATARVETLEGALREIAKVADEPRFRWSAVVGDIARAAVKPVGDGQ